MCTIDSMKSVLTLDALCERFHTPDVVHHELPSRNDRICNSLVGKIGVYSRFFDFANYRVLHSQFLVDILEYFQINLSQLSVIADAMVSHFEILCRVHGFVPTVEMDLFSFINHTDPIKVQIGELKVAEEEVSLLQLTRGRVVPLVGVNDQENVNVQGAGNDDVNEEGYDAAEADQTEQGDHVVHVEGIDIVAYDEAQAIVSDKPKRIRKKRKAADGAGGSGLPPKKLREDHCVSEDAGASTIEKSLDVLQEREGGGHGDSITGPNLRTQLASERFVVLTDSSHHFSTHAVNDEVTSIVRSSMPPSPMLTVAVATTIIADVTFAPVPRVGTGQVPPSIFRDSASTREANQDIAGPSHPVGI
ncbi:hypothetical protein Tco_0726751 [Tanacetum coccineum]|uniref:Uncharacterized protein n=1 Tax=Tanacetum coccineum TaxID=301880 RepID=A0ABQ4YIR4_9ASTR